VRHPRTLIFAIRDSGVKNLTCVEQRRHRRHRLGPAARHRQIKNDLVYVGENKTSRRNTSLANWRSS